MLPPARTLQCSAVVRKLRDSQMRLSQTWTRGTPSGSHASAVLHAHSQHGDTCKGPQQGLGLDARGTNPNWAAKVGRRSFGAFCGHSSTPWVFSSPPCVWGTSVQVTFKGWTVGREYYARLSQDRAELLRSLDRVDGWTVVCIMVLMSVVRVFMGAEAERMECERLQACGRLFKCRCVQK